MHSCVPVDCKDPFREPEPAAVEEVSKTGLKSLAVPVASTEPCDLDLLGSADVVAFWAWEREKDCLLGFCSVGSGWTMGRFGSLYGDLTRCRWEWFDSIVRGAEGSMFASASVSVCPRQITRKVGHQKAWGAWPVCEGSDIEFK